MGSLGHLSNILKTHNPFLANGRITCCRLPCRPEAIYGGRGAAGSGRHDSKSFSPSSTSTLTKSLKLPLPCLPLPFRSFCSCAAHRSPRPPPAPVSEEWNGTRRRLRVSPCALSYVNISVLELFLQRFMLHPCFVLIFVCCSQAWGVPGHHRCGSRRRVLRKTDQCSNNQKESGQIMRRE
eukprot:765830-Hanusia_phi.AAC.6